MVFLSGRLESDALVAVDGGLVVRIDDQGYAMDAGASPTALETGDVGILTPDLSLAPALIRLGRVTRRRIPENLPVCSVMYNGLAITLASFGVLCPIVAAIAYHAGPVAVALNSARLIRWNRSQGVRGR